VARDDDEPDDGWEPASLLTMPPPVGFTAKPALVSVLPAVVFHLCWCCEQCLDIVDSDRVALSQRFLARLWWLEGAMSDGRQWRH
jgi:hypothetical protein